MFNYFHYRRYKICTSATLVICSFYYYKQFNFFNTSYELLFFEFFFKINFVFLNNFKSLVIYKCSAESVGPSLPSVPPDSKKYFCLGKFFCISLRKCRANSHDFYLLFLSLLPSKLFRHLKLVWLVFLFLGS